VSDNVIEFPKPEPDKPDDDCVSIIATDDKPVKWFKYSVSFDAPDGSRYAFNIWAMSRDDADARVEAIRASAKLDGQVFAQIPAN
jgi:hypothetical protein